MIHFSFLQLNTREEREREREREPEAAVNSSYANHTGSVRSVESQAGKRRGETRRVIKKHAQHPIPPSLPPP